ncbi:unnamed protein product [Echinostoma caproni]|uniref:Ovule protein n=1 Tax=Echinostoma caproni TaxID=27848 RepID=A0A183AZ04_9TREM|nr:unnamed protein product [Echinostoma caproni]
MRMLFWPIVLQRRRPDNKKSKLKWKKSLHKRFKTGGAVYLFERKSVRTIERRNRRSEERVVKRERNDHHVQTQRNVDQHDCLLSVNDLISMVPHCVMWFILSRFKIFC